MEGQSRSSKAYLYSAYYKLLISRHSGMAHVNEGSHTHLSTSAMNHTCLNPQPQSITALWLVLISHPTEGRRLSWPRMAW